MDGGLVIAGKYHVVRPIGEGGMGAVYDAIHAKTGRRVALKLIHERTIAKGDPSARLRFEREARSAASIDSLHVVEIIDSGDDEHSGMPYIVMEYLQGEDLRVLLRRGPLSPTLAIAIASQLCMGLKKAHEEEVVHRDLKPANVFLAQADGERRLVKILDFGIAKLASEGAESVDLTSTGDVVGSPPYMSPEQLRAPRDVDHRTDIWSLGVVLYEMLTGHLPTKGVNAIGARVYAICHTPTPLVTSIVPNVSEELAALVHRALEIDPDERFQSADEMYAALRALSPSTHDILERDLARFVPRGAEVRDDVSVQSVTVMEKTAMSGGLAPEASIDPSSVACVRDVRRAGASRLGWLLAGLALGAAGIFAVALMQRSTSTTTVVSVTAAEPPATMAPPFEIAPAPVASEVAIATSPTADGPKLVAPPRRSVGGRRAPRSKPRPPAPELTADSRDHL